MKFFCDDFHDDFRDAFFPIELRPRGRRKVGGILRLRLVRIHISASYSHRLIQYWDKEGRIGCVIARPGFLWRRGRVHTT